MTIVSESIAVKRTLFVFQRINLNVKPVCLNGGQRSWSATQQQLVRGDSGFNVCSECMLVSTRPEAN